MDIQLTSTKDEAGFLKRTGYSFKEVISLTGVYAAYSYEELKESPGVSLIEHYPKVSVLINYDGLRLERTIDVKRKEIITNTLFKLEERGTGKGTFIFINQVLTASGMGFKLLICHAMGGLHQELFNGNKTWAKLGFTFQGAGSHKAYLKILSRHNVPEMPLHELLMAKKIISENGKVIDCGEKFWEEYGESWDGVFYLQKPSKNVVILCDYIVRKIERLRSKPKVSGDNPSKEEKDVLLLSDLLEKLKLLF